MKTLISGLQIIAENETHKHGGVLIEEASIFAVLTKEQCESAAVDKHISYSEDHCLIPGMIDLHIHGAAGVDVMDGTPESLTTLCETLPQEGTTTFLATTMTMAQEKIEQSIKNVANYIENTSTNGAKIAGLHLEGPFISKERLGAHSQEFVKEPDEQLFDRWQKIANNHIRMVTLAPEVKNVNSFIEHIVKQGVVAAIGHTNATMKQTHAAIKAGCKHATHLFNAMSGVHHRDPGAAAAILAEPKLLAELIVDGYHLCPEIVDMTYRIKGSDSLCLVTDSMRAKCLAAGEYELGGHQVFVKEGQARLADGVLAGSVLKMCDAARNMMDYTHCTIEDLVKLTSVNPAKQIGIYNQKGSIHPGKDADLVVLNKNKEVVLTLCSGQISFKSN